jgi:hypothetical protein
MKIRAMLLTLLATTAVSLTGYADNPPYPTPQQIATADYGAPLTIDWHAAIKGWFLRRGKYPWFLKIVNDPLSAQYIFKRPPEKGYTQTVLRGTMFGYCTIVEVNAKDSSGAYTGFLRYLFVFKNNHIIKVGGPGEFNSHEGAIATDFYID